MNSVSIAYYNELLNAIRLYIGKSTSHERGQAQSVINNHFVDFDIRNSWLHEFEQHAQRYISNMKCSGDVIRRAKRFAQVVPALRFIQPANSTDTRVARVIKSADFYYTLYLTAGVYGCNCPDEAAPRSANGSKLCKHVLTYRMLRRFEQEANA